MRKDFIGAGAACLSSCIGGASVVATRGVVGMLDPATLAALRFGIGALCLTLLVTVLGRRWPTRRDMLPILGLGMFFFAAFPFLFNLSLFHTTAARGSLVLSTLPFLTLLVAAALRSEQITPVKLAGVVAALVGVLVALGEGVAKDPSLRTGDLLMIATALCGAFYNVLSRPYLARWPALTYTTAGMIAGAAASLLWALAAGAPERIFDLRVWAWSAVAFLGIAGAALTFFLWSYALEHTTATIVATTVTLNPVVAILLGHALLGEPLPGRLALGLLAIVAGLALVGSKEGGWIGTVSRLQRRRHDARLLSRLDTRTLRDVGLLGYARRDRNRLAPPFWWLRRE
jgi:drug/metabolite transporter (DMT)-like permease